MFCVFGCKEKWYKEWYIHFARLIRPRRRHGRGGRVVRVDVNDDDTAGERYDGRSCKVGYIYVHSREIMKIK